MISRNNLNYGLYPKVEMSLCENMLSPKDDEDLYNLNEVLTQSYKGNFEGYLLEASADAIMTYLQNTTNKITTQWNKFKQDNVNHIQQIQQITDPQNVRYLQSGFRMKLPANYLIPNLTNWYKIRDYRPVVVSSINYNALKQYLDSVDSFYQQYYQALYVDKETTMRKVIMDRIFQKARGGEIIDQRSILPAYQFIADYDDQVDAISSNIDIINQVNNNFQKLINTMSTNEAVEFFKDTHFSLNEAALDNQPEANEGIKAQTKQLQKEQKPKSDKAYITNYYRVTTQLITSKMSACSKLRNQCCKMINQYIKLQPHTNSGGVIKQNIRVNK